MSRMPIPNDRVFGAFQCLFPGTSQQVTVTGTSAQSAAFESTTRVIRVFATVDMYIKMGSNPTAAVTDCFVPGGVIQYFGVIPGEKLAAIRSSSSGTLHITEGV